MLLVLDNCEHVIEAAAALAVDTLRRRRACGFWRPAASVTHRGRTRAPSVTAGEPSHSEAEALNFPADCSWNDEFELTDANAAIVAEM
jgi:predicted ATPase